MPEVAAGLCIPNTEVSQVLTSAVLRIGGDLNNTGIGDFKATARSCANIVERRACNWYGCPSR